MLIGYIRVSTTGQNLDVQKEQLQLAGCEIIYQEKRTGFDRRRPQLEKMLQKIRGEDILIISSLDRLAHSTHNLLEITRTLKENGTQFRSLRKPWADTTSAMGKFLLTVFSGLSEFERNLIKDRTAEGCILAQKRSVKFGKKHKLTNHQQDHVRRMLDEWQSMRAI